MATNDSENAIHKIAALRIAGIPAGTGRTLHVINSDTARCVECGNWHTEIRQRGNDPILYTVPGTLVHWRIIVPGEGAVDETFSDSKADAHNFARKLHGRSTRVSLDWSQLEVAAPGTLFWLEEETLAGRERMLTDDAAPLLGDVIDVFTSPIVLEPRIAWERARHARETFEEEADGYSSQVSYSQAVRLLRALSGYGSGLEPLIPTLSYTSPQVRGAELALRHRADTVPAVTGWVEAALDLEDPENADTVRYTVTSN